MIIWVQPSRVLCQQLLWRKGLWSLILFYGKVKLTAPRSHWFHKIKTYFLLTSSSDWVFSCLQWGDLGTQAPTIWLTLQGGSSAFSPKQREWQSVDIVLLVYGQVCRSCHVHHTKVSRSQIPWPNPNYKGGWETQSPGVSGMRNGTGA